MPSQPHLTVKAWLTQNYPGLLFYEEYKLSNGLRLDFLLPRHRLAVEVDGEQHEKYNNYFYKSMREFHNSIERDLYKDKYCKENMIKLIRIPEKKLKSSEAFEELVSAIKGSFYGYDEVQDLLVVTDTYNPRTESFKKWYESQKAKLKEKRRQEYILRKKKK